MATGGILLDNAETILELAQSPGLENLIGGEMEGWGLYQASQNAKKLEIFVQWIVVKGICDWGSGKLKDWQPFAAAAAADLVFTVLSSPNALPSLGKVGNPCISKISPVTLCQTNDLDK